MIFSKVERAMEIGISTSTNRSIFWDDLVPQSPLPAPEQSTPTSAPVTR